MVSKLGEAGRRDGGGDLFAQRTGEHLLALTEGHRLAREQAHHAVDLVLEDQPDAEHAAQALGLRCLPEPSIVVPGEVGNHDHAATERLGIRSAGRIERVEPV